MTSRPTTTHQTPTETRDGGTVKPSGGGQVGREGPLVFTGESVRGILADRKTQTRRVVTAHNSEFGSLPTRQFWPHGDFSRAFVDGQGSGSEYLHVPAHDDPTCNVCRHHGWEGTVHRLRPRTAPARCWDQTPDPSEGYKPPVSRIWVREAWRQRVDVEDGTPKAIHYLSYRANGESNGMDWHEYSPWKSPMRMPRWASRVVLTVLDVRVQRLQHISAADAWAEGVRPAGVNAYAGEGLGNHPDPEGATLEAFRTLWDSLNAKRGHGWEANPWVWAYTFTKLPTSADQQDG